MTDYTYYCAESGQEAVLRVPEGNEPPLTVSVSLVPGEEPTVMVPKPEGIDLPAEPENTLPQWLHQRFGKYVANGVDVEWDNITRDDQDYWAHEAQAVTRAVIRGGFKTAEDDVADESPGFRRKYFVKKLRDPDGKHDSCRYFVLDPQHDPLARQALSLYATLTDDAGNRGLCLDIREWLREIRRGEAGDS